MTLSEKLTWRGFVNQTTFPDISTIDKAPVHFYWGVDPSADSMTIGNLAMAMMVRHFMQHGHQAVLLVGGATGMIGDPDGKSDERGLKAIEEIAHNTAGIVQQYKTIFAGQDFEIVDNNDWFKNVYYLDFLRNVGKHMPMSQMLARDFVQTRLGEAGSGISYAEFSYALIQGYDFLHLYREKNVTLQVCGSDQWGNSIAGVELVRRITGGEVHVWSAPLVVNKTTGMKFGKTEEGAIWLDATKTSVYQFYQFWLNVDDEGVEDYLKIYTLFPPEEIARIMEAFQADRSQRHAQKALAYEVTKLVHGEAAANDARDVSTIVVSSLLLADNDYVKIKQILGSAPIDLQQPLAAIMVGLGLAKSNTEARRFIQSGAVFINNQKADGDRWQLTVDDVHAGIVVLRRGKNQVSVGEAQ